MARVSNTTKRSGKATTRLDAEVSILLAIVAWHRCETQSETASKFLLDPLKKCFESLPKDFREQARRRFSEQYQQSA